MNQRTARNSRDDGGVQVTICAKWSPIGYWGPFKPLVYSVSINSLDPPLGDERYRRESQYLELEIQPSPLQLPPVLAGSYSLLFVQLSFGESINKQGHMSSYHLTNEPTRCAI